ncbi:MAG: hypothetical protein R3F61_23200 [Myxococcota bacterium]
MVVALLGAAFASMVQVELGIAPAELHTVLVEVGAPAQTVEFVSGVPMRAKLKARAAENGTRISVDLEVSSTKVDRSLSKVDRELVRHAVTRGARVSPELVLPDEENGKALFFVGGEEEDGTPFGWTIRIVPVEE